MNEKVLKMTGRDSLDEKPIVTKEEFEWLAIHYDPDKQGPDRQKGRFVEATLALIKRCNFTIVDVARYVCHIRGKKAHEKELVKKIKAWLRTRKNKGFDFATLPQIDINLAREMDKLLRESLQNKELVLSNPTSWQTAITDLLKSTPYETIFCGLQIDPNNEKECNLYVKIDLNNTSAKKKGYEITIREVIQRFKKVGANEFRNIIERLRQELSSSLTDKQVQHLVVQVGIRKWRKDGVDSAKQIYPYLLYVTFDLNGKLIKVEKINKEK